MTAIRELALNVLYESPIFAKMDEQEQERAVVHFIVQATGSDTQRDLLARKETEEASNIALRFFSRFSQ